MTTLLIGYDLNKPVQSYGPLIAAIKGLGAWWHYLDSTWIVKTPRDDVAVRNLLSHHIDSNDELLVVDISDRSAAWIGFPATASDWLKRNL